MSTRQAPASLGAALILGLLGLAFVVWRAGSVWDFPRFLASVLLLAYLPGRLLLGLCRISAKGIEGHTLASLLGLVVSAASYWILSAIGQPHLLWAWPPLCAAGLLTLHRTRGTVGAQDPNASPDSSWGLVALNLAALLPLTFVPLYYRNLDRSGSGGLTFYPLSDVIFHLSIANELTRSVPPQAPFFPSVPLSYHYGMDLIVAMFSRAAHLSVLDLSARFVPSLFVSLTVLTIFSCAREWLGSGVGALATAFLVFFGEDLSFLPGMLHGGDGASPWAVTYFGMPTVVALFLMNPMLPALSLLFAALLCLSRYLAGGHRGWCVLGGVFCAALAGVKVFCAAQLLAALALSALVYRFRFRQSRPLVALAVSLLFLLPIVLAWRGEGSLAVVRMTPWPYVPASIFRMGIGDTTLGKLMVAFWSRGEWTFLSIGAFFFVALPLYLFLSLGVRAAGLPPLLKAIAAPRPETAWRFCAAAFVLVGSLSFILAVVPAGHAPQGQYNDAVWFYVQAKHVLWLFAVEGLIKLGASKGLLFRRALAGMVLALSLPSTVEYFAVQARQSLPKLPREAVAVIDFLGNEVPPGSVVLAREEVAQASIALAPCRAPLLQLFASQRLSREELAGELAGRSAFWNAWNDGTIQGGLLERLDVRYLIVDAQQDRVLPGGRAEGSGLLLRPSFQNSRFVVYAVSRP